MDNQKFDRIFKTALLVITLLFLYSFSKFSENGRYRYCERFEPGSTTPIFMVLDTRTGKVSGIPAE
jgi:hypothetical protein